MLKLLSQILTGIDLPCEVSLGRRFRIEHFGDIIISGDAVFGDDVTIRNGVTVGLRRTGVRGAPMIGNRVDIGAGAKILGDIRIGDDVSIGANAVVLTDVPSNSIAVGVPATIKPRRIPNRQPRRSRSGEPRLGVIADGLAHGSVNTLEQWACRYGRRSPRIGHEESGIGNAILRVHGAQRTDTKSALREVLPDLAEIVVDDVAEPEDAMIFEG